MKTGSEPVVICASINNTLVHRIYVDTGSSVEIMFEHCFDKLKRNDDKWSLKPCAQLASFDGHPVSPIGSINLTLTLTDSTNGRTSTNDVHFLVVKALSPYNIIFGRVAMCQFGVVASTIHGAMKFHTLNGIGTITSQQLPIAEVGQILQGNAITDNERKEDDGNTELVVINNLFPTQPVQIGKNLPTQLKRDLQILLRNNLDIFAWQPSDMTGVPRSLAEHALNERMEARPIRQKKRSQSGERNRAINTEVDKLVQAGILRESIFPSWVVNPVMVKKPNGSWRMCIDFTDLNKACPKD